MYADTRYMPRSPRSVSLGAALAINGLLIAGLASFVPNIIATAPPDPIKIFTPQDPVPPPERIERKAEPQPARQPDIYIPRPPIPQPQQPEMRGTDILPVDPPPVGPVERSGPVAIPETPPPLPPLIGAQQDPRFARDFQPEYPAQELRAQRDGSVSVRVLIGTDGRVKAIEKVNATSPAFFEATRRQALARWRFKPATRGGVPQESWKTMNVRFELKNA
jgi:protein TonB